MKARDVIILIHPHVHKKHSISFYSTATVHTHNSNPYFTDAKTVAQICDVMFKNPGLDLNSSLHHTEDTSWYAMWFQLRGENLKYH